MPRIAPNADVWAEARVGIFFPAHNQTPKDGNLTGQCVTLNKWDLAEMTNVPNPFAARGDARYVGDRLVAEGHAIEVPYEQRRRGDFAVYKYGLYGHIGLILSGDRIFEQNANVGGAAKRVLADGTVVYASRIGSLNESWRPVRPAIYRILSYTEEEDEMVNTTDEAAELIRGVFKREPSQDEIQSMLGRDWKERIVYLRTSEAGQQVAAMVNTFPQLSKQAIDLNTQVVQLNQMLKDLQDRPTKQQLEAAIKLADDAQKASDALVAKNKELEDEKAAAEKTGNAFTRWIGEQLNKILGKG